MNFIEPLFIHHMVGTAGNTFCRAIANSTPARDHVELRYGINNIEINPDFVLHKIQKPCLFRGHNIYGLIELCNLNYKYSTILRNPYDRLITDWFWKRTIDAFKSANLTYSRYNSLNEFYSFLESSPHLEFYIHHLGVLDYINSQHFCIEECSRVTNYSAYNSAITSLKKKFDFVGISEFMDLSIYSYSKLKNITNIKSWLPVRHMKTPNRPQFNELPSRYQNIIKNKTVFDRLLYEEYRENFHLEHSHFERDNEFKLYFDSNSSINNIESSEIDSINFNETEFISKIKLLKDNIKIGLFGIGTFCHNLIDKGLFSNFEFVAQFDENTNLSSKLSLTTYPDFQIPNFEIDVLIITSTRLNAHYRRYAIDIKKINNSKFIVI